MREGGEVVVEVGESINKNIAVTVDMRERREGYAWKVGIKFSLWGLISLLLASDTAGWTEWGSRHIHCIFIDDVQSTLFRDGRVR